MNADGLDRPRSLRRDRLRAHTQGSYRSRKRAVFKTKFVIIMFAMFAGALALHAMWSFEPMQFGNVMYCMPMRGTLEVHLIIKKIQLLVTVILPMSLLAGVDLMLLLKLLLHVAFKEDEDDDEDIGDVYDNSRDENIAKLPLHECQKETRQSKRSHSANRSCELASRSSISNPAFGPMYAIVTCHANSTIDSSTATGDEISCRQIKETNSLPKLDALHEEILQQSMTSLCSSDESAQDTVVLHAHSVSNNPIIELKSSLSSRLENSLRPQTTCLTKVDFIDRFEQTILLTGSSNERSPLSKQLVDTQKKMGEKRYNFHSRGLNEWQSYDYTSCTTMVSRSENITLEDDDFPEDIISGTITLITIGFICAATNLPPTLTQVFRLFIDNSHSRPSSHAIQKAIFFESLLKLNAGYKFFAYLIAMASFRKAIAWLLTHWIPNKITRMSRICMWHSTDRTTQENTFV